MRLDSSIKAEIRRLKRVENWSTHAIARHFQVHQTTVDRALRSEPEVEYNRPKNSKKKVFPPTLEPYKAFLAREMKKETKRPTSSLLACIREQGYKGSVNTLRRGLAILKDKAARAFTKRVVFAGDEAQVDWCELGKINFCRFEAKVYVLVIVLSWSRDIYAQACLDMQFDTLARGHVRAFERFGGVPVHCLYDNMRTVVTSTSPGFTEFNHKFLSFAREYGFKLRNCNPKQPQEKGRVERSIRYLKENFMPSRSFIDLSDFNAQLIDWLNTTRLRQWTEAKQFTVEERMQRERKHLTPLPAKLWYPKKQTICRVRKTPYISYERCQYSVPPKHVGENVTVFRDDDTITIWSGDQIIAQHRREREPGKVIEDRAHIDALRKLQGPGSSSVLKGALLRMLPAAEELLMRKKKRGDKIGSLLRQLYALSETHGPENINAAIELALEQGTVDIEAIKLLNKKIKPKKNDLRALLSDPKLRAYKTKHQSIDSYTFLSSHGNKTQELT